MCCKKKYSVAVSTILIVASLSSFFLWNYIKTRPLKINTISLEDRQSLGNFLLMVASNPDDLKRVSNNFWNILQKYDAISESRSIILKEEIALLFFLPKLFYNDARVAIKNKKPFKSPERKRLEKHFLKNGFLTKQQIENDNKTMELIAKRKPVAAAHGVEIFIDETRINEMLKEWSDREMVEIIDKLFMPRAKGNSP